MLIKKKKKKQKKEEKKITFAAYLSFVTYHQYLHEQMVYGVLLNESDVLNTMLDLHRFFRLCEFQPNKTKKCKKKKNVVRGYGQKLR